MSTPLTLTLRLATAADARQLWEWRNDPDVRANSFNSEEIPWETHCAWLERKVSSPDCRIWILERGSTPVGEVRYERRDMCAEVSVLIASPFRGQGLGTRILQLSAPIACQELGVLKLQGIIKAENQVSLRAFERASFSLMETVKIGAQHCYKVERRCAPDGS